MKLSDYKNEDALDLLADLLQPVSEIMTDQELKKLALQPKADTFKIAQHVLKNHKKNVIAIFARIDGKEVKDYSATITEMFSQLLEIINDKTILDFFASQVPKNDGASFGPVTANIAATDEA